jgi:hypothetical protein
MIPYPTADDEIYVARETIATAEKEEAAADSTDIDE